MQRIGVLYLIAIFFFASCSQRTALIISDPYVDTVGNWGGRSRLFIIRAWLKGIRISHEIISDNRTLTGIIEELTSIPDIVVLSRWNASVALEPVLSDSHIIITGARPFFEERENVSSIIMDKTTVLADIGRIAGNIAFDQAKPALVLHKGGLDELLAAYEVATEGLYPIVEVEISETSDSLPDDFIRKVPDASVFLLLAGAVNILAFQATQDFPQPVISEFAFANGRWSKRIIASIEDDHRRLRSLLLSVMDSNNRKLAIYYPGKLEM